MEETVALSHYVTNSYRTYKQSSTSTDFKLKELKKNTMPASEELVLWDEYGAGYGDYVALSEGGEAAQPFLPERKPVDAYNAALLDDIEL